MLRLKIGVQLASLQLPLKKGLETAARLGAAAVEIDARGPLRPEDMSETALRELRRWLSDHELRVAAVSFRTRRGYDRADDLDRRVAATKAAMKFAHSIGAQYVVNQIGPVPAEAGTRAWNQMVDVLTDLGRFGHHVGALLAAQTGTESGPDLARLIAALPERSIGVNFDPGHLIINGFSAVEAAAALGPHIVHVYARDGVRDLARGRGLEVQLGRGVADIPALLGALEEHDYRGYLTIVRENAADPAGEIATAMEYLKSL